MDYCSALIQVKCVTHRVGPGLPATQCQTAIGMWGGIEVFILHQCHRFDIIEKIVYTIL